MQQGKEIQLHHNNNNWNMTTIDEWFEGKDVAKCLGYENTRESIRNYVDERDKIKFYD